MSLPTPAKAFMRWLRQVLRGLDHLLNAILGGDATQTVSLRAALARDTGTRWGCILCKVLDWFQKDHCTIELSKGPGEV
jgi:hypothetical protein